MNIPGGNYTVTVTDNNGCTASHYFKIRSFSDIEISGVHQHSDCPEDTGSIDITVNGGSTPYSYLWSNGATTADLINIPAGDYTVTVTDKAGCTASHFFRIKGFSDIKILGKVTPSSCTQNTGSIELMVEGGSLPYSYLWSTGATTANVDNLQAGDYVVTVTDSNECTASHYFKITTINTGDDKGECLKFKRDEGDNISDNFYQEPFTSGAKAEILVCLQAFNVPDAVIVTVNDNEVLNFSAGAFVCDDDPIRTDAMECRKFCVEVCDQVIFTVLGDICPAENTRWDLIVTCEKGPCDIKGENRKFNSSSYRSNSPIRLIEGTDIPYGEMSLNSPDFLKVFPNPVTDVLSITNSDPMIEYQTLRIMNSVGKVLHTERLSGLPQLRVDASAFPKGIYIIELTDDYGNRVVKKFMKLDGFNSF